MRCARVLDAVPAQPTNSGNTTPTLRFSTPRGVAPKLPAQQPTGDSDGYACGVCDLLEDDHHLLNVRSTSENTLLRLVPFRQLLDEVAYRQEMVLAENMALRQKNPAVGPRISESVLTASLKTTEDKSSCNRVSGQDPVAKRVSSRLGRRTYTECALVDNEARKRAELKHKADIQRKFDKLEMQSMEDDRPITFFLDCFLREHGLNPQVSAAAIARALNSYNGREELGDEMIFDTFVELMTIDTSSLSVAVANQIGAIRGLYLSEDMNKLFARFAYVPEHVGAVPNTWHRRDYITWIVDPFSFVLILSNAILLAVSADVDPENPVWDSVETMFTALFTVELISKLVAFGCHDFFLGADLLWNWSDFLLVAIAVVDCIMTLAYRSSDGADMHLFTLMRLARLLRVTRLVRFLRFKMFKELLLMIKGMIAGLRTLFWAIILLLVVIFSLGLLMRQTFGRWCDNAQIELSASLGRPSYCDEAHLRLHGPEMFGSVSRSSLTVFRCFTEGCASTDGTPLLPHVYRNKFGDIFLLVYILAFLAVTFGLFNLILAVFVENTMEAAKTDERRRRAMRHQHSLKVARTLRALVTMFCKACGDDEPTTTTSMSASAGIWGFFTQAKVRTADFSYINARLDVEIPRNVFLQVMEDPQAELLLDDLDVSVTDPLQLFDTLDADGSGTVDLGELIKGIMKYMHSYDKGDSVATLLCVRAVQHQVRTLDTDARQQLQETAEHLDRIDGLMVKLVKYLRVPDIEISLGNSPRQSSQTFRLSTFKDEPSVL